MKMLWIAVISLILGLMSGVVSLVYGCTDFRVTAKDGTVLIARSMEYAIPMHANLRTSPRGRDFVSAAPNNKSGLTWKGKYGYVFLDALDQDVAVDGMNEKGLSFEALYLPGLAKYQEVTAGEENKALSYLSIGDWILSNFDSVDQVKSALQTVTVYAQELPQMNNQVFPLHYAVYDAMGKGIVIEYVEGKLHVYDNAIGVMTNSPQYPWHLTNMNNYVHLTPTNPSPIVDNGVKFAATGQGFGMIGLPGDISPPSRFVRIASILNVVIPASNALDSINLAEHVINNVDIPLGLARESGTATNELTQWVVFKDLTHKVFYYRTYGNLTLRSVSLDKLNFAEGAARLKMPIETPATILDMDAEFLKKTG